MIKSTKLMQDTQDTRVRPFLKWAGGKYRLIDKLLPHLKGKRLIEPFVGAGAVFLNLEFENYIVNDINTDLINLYKHLKKEKMQFVTYAKTFFNEENNSADIYYQLRDKFNSNIPLRERAALFLYFNRYGYNGLCRYNKSGGYNVPFGRYKKIYFPEKEMLHFVKISSKVQLSCSDYRAVMMKAKVGDVIYCDPPYVPLSKTSNFTAYSMDRFREDEQNELAELAKSLANKGIRVVISNHENEITRELYKDAKIETLLVQRLISSDGEKRNKAKELIAVFG